MISVPHVVVHPDNLCVYSQLYTDSGDLYRPGNMSINTKKYANCHKLSQQSKRKLNKAISYMCHLAPEKKVKGVKYEGYMKFKVSFVTLTLSSQQQHSDNEIKKTCLAPFLDYMRKVYHAKRFVWKAERQRNGNIHFHILFDVFIPYDKIRYQWNKCQNRLGYIDRYFSNSNNCSAIHSFADSYNLVNSTDVHSVKKIRDLKRYLAKYMIKSGNSHKQRVKRNSWNLPKHYEKGLITVSHGAKLFLKNIVNSGRVWSCSYDLVNISGAVDICAGDLSNEVDKLLANSNVYVKRERYFCYIGFDFGMLRACNCPALLSLLTDYLLTNFERPPELL